MIGQVEALSTTTVLDESQGMQLFALPLIHANRTVINIEALALESTAASIHATGKLVAEAQSAMGATGAVRIEVTGLDKLITAATREALRKKTAQSTLALLAIAKGLGRTKTSNDGKPVYVFDVELPASGRVTINEIPLDLIMNKDADRLLGGE